MIRLLLLPLTAILITLAVMLQNVWLYTATGIVTVIGLAVLATSLWQRYQQEQSSSPSTQKPSEPSLDELGITEIRPKTSGKPASDAGDEEMSSRSNGSSPGRATAREKAPKTVSATAKSGAAPSSVRPKQPAQPEEEETESETDDDDGDSIEEELFTFVSEKPLNYPVDDLLENYLRSLHSSIRAHTVGLLGLNVYAESCSIEAVVSRSDQIREDNRISLHNHFLQNVSPNEPVTILIAEGDAPAFEELGYYDGAVDVDQVAVAPLQVSDEMVGYLLADRTPAEAPIQTVYYTLLAEFAELLGTILYTKMEDRPRREIIAEEIEQSHTNDRSLALALIHPNNADTVLRGGPESVAHTEYLLRHTLQQLTPDGRIERFGELIYGVFYYDSDGSIDAWAQDVQTAFSDKNEGVNIGIALYGKRHENPEDLRSDAAEALRVAYEAGQNECIIFE